MERRLLEPPAMAGLLAASVVVVVLIWRWDPISAGHPSYPIFYGVAIALGLSAVIVVLRRSRERRPVLSWLGAIGLVTLGFAVWWVAPFPADQVALDVLVMPQFPGSGFGVVDHLRARG